MRQTRFSFKRHALPAVMTFFFLIAQPLCFLDTFGAENNDLQELLDNAESEVNIEQLLDLVGATQNEQNFDQ